MSYQYFKLLPTPPAMSAAPSGPLVPYRSVTPFLESTIESFRPHPRPGLPNVTLSLRVPDLNHPAVYIFFKHCNPSIALLTAVDTVFAALYKPTQTNSHIPPTRSVTLILRSIPGISQTIGSPLDDHKEIHLSLDHIGSFRFDPPNRPRDEIQGVLVYEMVRCFQWSANGTAPVSLCRGIASFVRLKAGLSSPHWKKKRSWNQIRDSHCVAYFLEWLEDTHGAGTVMTINNRLRDGEYEQKKFWKDIFGKTVNELWKDYSKTLD